MKESESSELFKFNWSLHKWKTALAVVWWNTVDVIKFTKITVKWSSPYLVTWTWLYCAFYCPSDLSLSCFSFSFKLDETEISTELCKCLTVMVSRCPIIQYCNCWHSKFCKGWNIYFVFVYAKIFNINKLFSYTFWRRTNVKRNLFIFVRWN